MHLRSLSGPVQSSNREFLAALLVFVVVLGALFFPSFVPGYTLSSNDGPLGRLMSDCRQMSDRINGNWQDLNSVGYREGAASPSITYGLMFVLGPVGFSKFYAPIALLILALGAWCFFRQLGFESVACILGGLAAMLNSDFFSAACWGVASHPITVGMCFLSLAALSDTSSPQRWVRAALAGCAVGMGVLEGADIGAIFSLLVAAFILALAWMAPGARVRNLLTGFGRLGVVAVISALLAGQFIAGLVSIQKQGVPGAPPETRTAIEQWEWATQWSLPKRESLGVLIPGLFGYRMDALGGGNYWGAVGRAAAWDQYLAGDQKEKIPSGYLRFTGGGEYAGVLVVLIAIWAVAQAIRKRNSAFAQPERKLLWFWTGVAILAMLLAFGRYAPLYRILYVLPYFSTIRNPTKFLHIFSFALVVLFAYGIRAICQRCLAQDATPSGQPNRKANGQRPATDPFNRRFSACCVVAMILTLVGWMVYGSQQSAMERYLQSVRFNPAMARAIAAFSIQQVGIFVLVFAIAAALLWAILNGKLGGTRARLGGILLGLLLAADLGRANWPWITYWNYPTKYAANPILDELRHKPYEYRVAGLPNWLGASFQQSKLLRTEKNWSDLYSVEWSQHLFPYYNIQSPDLVQMRLMPADLALFEKALQFQDSQETLYLISRRWQLTNTRYLLGVAGFLPVLNEGFDPVKRRFSIVARFELVPKEGITRPVRFADITPNPYTNGDYALFEFSGALPRAALYTNWLVSTNDTATLKTLASPEFDPTQTVLVADPLPVPVNPSGAGTGMVSFVSYEPKRIVLRANAGAPSVLLLNDKFDPHWKVSVDGKPDSLLRCNYLMRGVTVPAGEHLVEFRFDPGKTLGSFYVSLSGVVFGLALVGFLTFGSQKSPDSAGPARNETPKGS
jgi:hypothetical protein